MEDITTTIDNQAPVLTTTAEPELQKTPKKRGPKKKQLALQQVQQITQADENFEKSTERLINAIETVGEIYKEQRMETNNTPPVENVATRFKLTERNSLGLLEGYTYIPKDGGRKVDWYAMIPKEYIVPNRQNFEKRNQPVPTSIEGLADKDLLILLEGFRYIAELRGFEYIEVPIVSTTSERTTSTVQIRWIGNFETQFRPLTTSAVGDATLESTKGFGFIGPISENRAFCRVVRSFLKIPVLGKDELNSVEPNKNVVSVNDDAKKLASLINNFNSLMVEKGFKFEQIKRKIVEEGNSDAMNYKTSEDMSHLELINFTQRLQQYKGKTTPA